MSLDKNINFLVVDDMSFYLSFTVDALANLGFKGKIITAKNATDAVAKLKKIQKENFPLHFVISDLHMGDGTGIDLLKAVRASKNFKETPFLLLTTEEESSFIIEAFEHGVDNYMYKPIDQELLLEKIEFCYNKRNPIK